MSFEDLVKFLRDRRLIKDFKQLLCRLNYKCSRRHTEEARLQREGEEVKVRVVLAGYMIAYRPTHVFESMETNETNLFEAAVPLMEKIETMCTVLREHKFFSHTEVTATSKPFIGMLCSFICRFKAWKIPDEDKLANRITHALEALYSARAYLPADEPAESKLNVEFNTQIERLRSKYSQIKGPEALAELDQRLTTTTTTTSSSASASSGVYNSVVPGRMTNEQLAHELLLDPGFQLSEDGTNCPGDPVFNRIRETFHKAFWDSLVDDLKLAAPCYVRVGRVLSEIKEGLLDLAGSREGENIEAAIEVDFIKSQADLGLFGWTSSMALFSSIIDIIKRVQAPKRDAETTLKWTELNTSCVVFDLPQSDHPRAFCLCLEFFLDRVNAMRIDSANARLRLIAPVIKDHGIDYERGKLQDKINAGDITLDKTLAWMKQAINALPPAAQELKDRLIAGEGGAYAQILFLGFVNIILLDSPAAFTLNELPETLRFEQSRIAFFNKQLKNFVVLASCASIVSIKKQFELAAVGVSSVNANETLANDFGARLLPMISQTEALTLDAILAIVPAEVPQAGVRNAFSSPAVHSIMKNRVRAFILAMYLYPDATAEFTSGNPVLVEELRKIFAKILSVYQVNKNVYLPFYNKIIAEACPPSE